MKPFILGGQYSTNFEPSGRTEAAVTFRFRFVDGKLPPSDELSFYVAAPTEQHGPGSHWSVYTHQWSATHQSLKTLSLIEACQPFETVESVSYTHLTLPTIYSV